MWRRVKACLLTILWSIFSFSRGFMKAKSEKETGNGRLDSDYEGSLILLWGVLLINFIQ